MERSRLVQETAFGWWRRHGLTWAVAGLLAVTLSGCATTSEPEDMAEGEDDSPVEEFAFTFDQEAAPEGVFSEYHIAPGDIMDVLFQIKTWKEEQGFTLAVDHTVAVRFPKNKELSETQMVRPDGRISLPYLGPLYVVGMTVEELTATLREKYAGVLKDPELYVVVPDFRSAIKELKQDLHTAPRGLSRLVTVRPDGYATFAMLGDVFVAGKTVPGVNLVLNEKYRTVMPGLTVDLFLEKAAGSSVYVLGEVQQPGPVPILKPMPILDALARAGSHTKSAKLSNVIVLRQREHKLVATKVNVKKSLRLKKGGEFLFLQPGDIVYVPKTFIRRAGDVMRDIADIVLFNGWSIGVSYDLQNTKVRSASTSTTISTSTDFAGRETRTESTTSEDSKSSSDAEF